VQRANADVEKGTVEINYDEGTVTTEDLKDAIEEAGYTVAA
jgi:copper chaperone CopZ